MGQFWGESRGAPPMTPGKTLFAQLMDFLPWSTFARSVDRYGGDQRVRTLACTEQFRAMAFAQLTYRESLRDIEVCLSAQPAKLYHMGFREPIHRSTLSDANEARDWRIYAEFAQRLIRQARRLYADESLGDELKSTVYALDSTTIDLCLSIFPWAHFRTTKAAVKMHTLLDLRGNIPSFIHVSDGKLHDVHALDLLLPEAGAIYVMDRGYIDFARLHVLHLAGAFFVTRAKSNMDAHRVYSAPTDRTTGIICDQTIAPCLRRGKLWMVTTPASIIPNPCGASASGTPKREERWCSSPTSSGCRPRPSAHSTKAAGKSNCSSNGSNSICGSNASSGHPKMQCRPKSGSPSRSTSLSPSSRSGSPWTPRSTHCDRSSRSPSSRKCLYIKHLPKTVPNATLCK